MDVELIRRAKSRDPDAFTELMRSQMNSMYKTARQILQSDEDIADAVQDTLLTCWQKLDQLRDERAWRAWMMRILINNCYEQIRKHGLESSMDILPEAAAYSENYEQTEWQDLLWRLDEKYRMVLILYYLEGFRTGEIAQILGMPEATVRTRLKEAGPALRRNIMEEKQMSEMDKIMQGWNNDTVIPEVVTRKAEEAFSRIHRECEENSEKSIICGANKGTSTVHRRWKRYVAAFIAAAAVGGTVFADTRLHLAELFPKEMNSPQAQEQIMTDIAVEVTGQVHMPEAYREEGTEDVFWGRKVIPDASPVLSIEEVQYDGTTLYIYGASTENGRKYELNADRLYINDKEYGPVGTTNLNEWTGEDGYTFTTDLSALHLEDDFTVTLPLSIYQGEERFQNQELSFTMSAKANIQKAEDQTFAHDGFTIYVTNIVRTTNVVRFSVRYQLTEEEREKLDETNTGLTSVISGDEVEDGQNGFTSGYEAEDGYVEEHIHAGISPDLDQIALQTLLVENGGYVRDGKVIAEDMIRLNE